MSDQVQVQADLKTIQVKGVEDWREYEFGDGPYRTAYRIDKPTTVQFRADGRTHRVTDETGVVHCVPAPGYFGCILRWKGAVIA